MEGLLVFVSGVLRKKQIRGLISQIKFSKMILSLKQGPVPSLKILNSPLRSQTENRMPTRVFGFVK